MRFLMIMHFLRYFGAYFFFEIGPNKKIIRNWIKKMRNTLQKIELNQIISRK